ncbi:L,D-transpeptidase family protein [Stenotrophomonas mori]|uniref:L,D-transpeptidase family protein n=1 Tax=Stenotrophomonas mori TaxID=2871096 RepID=UPI003CE57834
MSSLAVLATFWTTAALAATPVDEARQLVVVTAPSWDAPAGHLQAYERGDGGWRPHGDGFDVALGRNGSAWGLGLHPSQQDGPHKREGDGRSPAGVFGIGEAFGYASRIGGALPYRPMLASNYCMDVPDSPLYNRIVDAEAVGSEAVAGSTEPMRLDLHNDGDRRYREGFVIEHNPQAVPGQGSCIFAHLWRQPGEATAGCTAMEPGHMTALLAWLDPAVHPLFVLLPEAEYRRLQQSWGLPATAGAAP